MSIVVVISQLDFVIMGTDSLVTEIDFKTNKKEFRTVNKIHHAGQYYFAMTGMIGIPQAGFDATPIVKNHLMNSKDFKLAISNITKELDPELQRAYRYMKHFYHESFILQEYRGLTVAIIGLENGLPMAYELKYNMSDSDSMTFKIESNYIPKENTLGYGKSDDAFEYLNSLPRPLPNSEVFIEEMIIYQAKCTPNDVGGPVNILAVTTNDGPIWVKKLGHD